MLKPAAQICIMETVDAQKEKEKQKAGDTGKKSSGLGLEVILKPSDFSLMKGFVWASLAMGCF